jgi:hypothetical protein
VPFKQSFIRVHIIFATFITRKLCIEDLLIWDLVGDINPMKVLVCYSRNFSLPFFLLTRIRQAFAICESDIIDQKEEKLDYFLPTSKVHTLQQIMMEVSKVYFLRLIGHAMNEC